MATSIAKLSVLLTANTGGMRKGLDQGTSAIKRFSSGLGNVIKMAARSAAALAAVGAAAATALAVKGLRDVDRLAKTADKLGLSINELQGFRLAASEAGVDAEKLATGFARMQANIGDASSGIGDAKMAFEDLGLSAAAMINKSPAEQFREIADAVAQIENPTKRTQIAMDIFGRSGSDLINVLSGGASGLDAAAKAADDLGLSMTRIDARKVEQANDAFGRVKLIIKSVSQQLAIALAPFLKFVSDRMVAAATTGTSMGDRISTALGWVVNAAGFVADGIKLIVIGFKTLQFAATKTIGFIVKGLTTIIKAVRSVAGLVGIDSDLLDNAVAFGESFSAGLDEAADEIGKSIGKLANKSYREEFNQAFKKIKAEAQLAAESTIDVVGPEAPKSIANAASDASSLANTRFQEASDERREQTEELRRIAEELAQTRDDLNAALPAGRTGLYLADLSSTLETIMRQQPPLVIN